MLSGVVHKGQEVLSVVVHKGQEMLSGVVHKGQEVLSHHLWVIIILYPKHIKLVC